MMAAPVVLVLVTRNAIVKCYFTGQPGVRQQFKRPVDGSESDVGILLFHQLIQFIGREMSAGFQKSPQNCAALLGLLQTDASQMPQENVFGLADVLGRDARLIVDSFLQHG
jgi:hypothetical protein